MRRRTDGGLGSHIEPGDHGPTGVGSGQGREYAHDRGFSCSIRAKDTEDRTGRNRQVDAVNRLRRAVTLHQPLGLDHQRAHWRLDLLVN